MQRAALYSRVSTDRQTTKNQVLELRTWAQHLGYDVEIVYEDVVSGDATTRPQLEEMLLAAHQRKFDVLLVWSIDRLSRDGALKALEILEKIERTGVRFRSYTEQFLDSGGMFREAIVGFLATVAKMEKSRLKERIKAGQARARKQGRVPGRPTDIDDEKKLKIQQLQADGWSQRRIATEMGFKSHRALGRYLVPEKSVTGTVTGAL